MNKMIVLAKAAEGKKEELAKWYDEEHLVDLLAVPGMLSVERHDIVPVKAPEGSPKWDFVMIYVMDGDDPGPVMQAMGAKMANVKMSPTLESVSTLSVIGLSKGERMANEDKKHVTDVVFHI